MTTHSIFALKSTFNSIHNVVREFFKILKNKLTITTHSIFALKSTFNSIHNVVRERWLVKNLKEVFFTVSFNMDANSNALWIYIV